MNVNFFYNEDFAILGEEVASTFDPSQLIDYFFDGDINDLENAITWKTLDTKYPALWKKYQRRWEELSLKMYIVRQRKLLNLLNVFSFRDNYMNPYKTWEISWYSIKHENLKKIPPFLNPPNRPDLAIHQLLNWRK